MRNRSVMVVLAMCLAGAASAGEGEKYGEKTEKMPEQGAMMMVEPLENGELVRVLGIVHAGEMDLAKMALTKSEDPRMQDFARRMLDEHRQLDLQTVSLLEQHALKGQDSTTSRVMLRDNNRLERKLADLEGSQFEQEFLAAQVQMHEQALQVIEVQRASGRFPEDMMELLNRTRTTMQGHLQEARDLQTMREQTISG